MLVVPVKFTFMTSETAPQEAERVPDFQKGSSESTTLGSLPIGCLVLVDYLTV